MSPDPVWTSDDQRHTLYHGDATLLTPQILHGRTVDALCADPPYRSISIELDPEHIDGFRSRFAQRTLDV